MTGRSDSILVTGGNGFIGRYVCSILSTHGKNVIALERKNPKQFTEGHLKIEKYENTPRV